MEILFIILFFVVIGSLLSSSGGSSTPKASMGELEIRKRPFNAGENGDGPLGIGVEIKGLIPVLESINLEFVTTVSDVTRPTEEMFVISYLESFQEDRTPVYQCTKYGGWIEPNQGYLDWVRVGVIFPELLVPPYGGDRKLRIILRLIDRDNPVPIIGGVPLTDTGFLIEKSVPYDFTYSGKGYLEAAENRNEARALAIKLAMAVAMSDGSLHDTEGMVIKQWIERTLSVFKGSQRESLKELYNTALKISYSDAVEGNLSLGSITSRLDEIAEGAQKYEAIELCFDVMSADGVADENELHFIHRIAEALGLDFDEIQKLEDKSLMGLDTVNASLEDELGIKSDWTKEQINLHIRREFAKWIDLKNSLPEGRKRENAQRRIDMLAEARKKYA